MRVYLQQYLFVRGSRFVYIYKYTSIYTYICTHIYRLIGSFYGFDQPLTCSNAYTVYIRQDPFPRMMIALDTFSRIEEWTVAYKFHAFDIPVPGTCCYSLQHTTPSIHSTDTRYSRHRLCSANRFPENPWDFRMLIYVFPARIEECSLAYDDTLESIVQGF